MDETIVIPLICAGISAIVALITTDLTLRSSKKQDLEQNYDEKLEELQNLYIEVKMHIKAEIRDWWIAMEYGGGEPARSNYIYPIDKIVMLTERYEPSLRGDIEQVVKAIQILRGNDDPEDWMPLEAYYYQYITGIDFSKTEKNLAIKFKEINKKYHQKRTSKSLLLAKKTQHVPNNQNQSMTISSDEW